MGLAQGKSLPTNILMSMGVELTKVPSTPGVYKFFSNHEIIYIGKAKNLKKKSFKLFW
jgi:excinuclease UvrABC nuclease subunit